MAGAAVSTPGASPSHAGLAVGDALASRNTSLEQQHPVASSSSHALRGGAHSVGAGPQQHHLHAAGTNTSFRSLGHNASSLGHHHHPGGGPPPGVAEGDEPLSPALAIVLLYGLMLLMVGAQAGLFYWKKRHKRSYELVTLVGLWVMPAIISLQLHFWRFIAVWACYSAVTGYLLYTCSGRQMATTTPRTVYGWFLGVFRISKLTGQIGYVLLITEMLGAKPLLDMILPQGASLIVLWYGLYFGILTRDCAEVASDQMAASLGTGGRRIVSTVNACGICGNELRDMSHITGAAAVAAGGAGGAAAAGETAAEKCVQLSCKHCFHDLCIKGWTMVGKKDTCPLCSEKVDMRPLTTNREWDTRNLTWIQMLDAIRYMVVWNPIIFTAFSVVFHLVAPHHHHHAGPPLPPGVVAAAGPLSPPPMSLH